MKHRKDKHDYLEDNYPLCLQPIIEKLHEEFDKKLKCINEKHMEEFRSLKDKITKIDIKVSNSDIAGLEGVKEYIRHIQEQLQNVSDKNAQLDTTIGGILEMYNTLRENIENINIEDSLFETIYINPNTEEKISHNKKIIDSLNGKKTKFKLIIGIDDSEPDYIEKFYCYLDLSEGFSDGANILLYSIPIYTRYAGFGYYYCMLNVNGNIRNKWIFVKL